MPSDFSDRARKQHGHQAAAASGSPFPPPEQPEQLPCPRCDSPNTKFCYYNNYNFSQPRHFCKSCRRYWTRGGSLRDIPVGGGTRKNSRRSRHASSAAATSSSGPAPVLQPHIHASASASASPAPFHGSNVGGMSADETLRPPPCGSFTSLLTTQAPAGFLALGGLGLGIDDDNMAFGLNRGASTWAFPGLVDSVVGSSESSLNDHSGASFGMSGTWHIDSGVDGGGDCFSWPDLAIFTPGNGT